MGKLGQKREKKANLSDISEDAKVESITVNGKEQPQDNPTEEANVSATASTKPPKEKKVVVPNPPDHNDSTVNDDFILDPSKLAEGFKFEEAATDTSNPFNIPLAEETKGEGQTFKTGHQTSPPPSQENNTVSFEESLKGDTVSPPPPPPPPTGEADMFDEVPEGSEPGGDGFSIPAGLAAWGAKKQAKWIVDMEAMLMEGFAKNKAKINIVEVKQVVNKYPLPDPAKLEISKQVEGFNDAVDENIAISPEAKKGLQDGWEAVLSQHTEISKHLTPEVALAISHGLVIWQLASATKELKAYGKQMILDIKSVLAPYAPKEEKKDDSKKE